MSNGNSTKTPWGSNGLIYAISQLGFPIVLLLLLVYGGYKLLKPVSEAAVKHFSAQTKLSHSISEEVDEMGDSIKNLASAFKESNDINRKGNETIRSADTTIKLFYRKMLGGHEDQGGSLNTILREQRFFHGNEVNEPIIKARK